MSDTSIFDHFHKSLSNLKNAIGKALVESHDNISPDVECITDVELHFKTRSIGQIYLKSNKTIENILEWHTDYYNEPKTYDTEEYNTEHMAINSATSSSLVPLTLFTFSATEGLKIGVEGVYLVKSEFTLLVNDENATELMHEITNSINYTYTIKIPSQKVTVRPYTTLQFERTTLSTETILTYYVDIELDNSSYINIKRFSFDPLLNISSRLDKQKLNQCLNRDSPLFYSEEKKFCINEVHKLQNALPKNNLYFDNTFVQALIEFAVTHYEYRDNDAKLLLNKGVYVLRNVPFEIKHEKVRMVGELGNSVHNDDLPPLADDIGSEIDAY